MRSGFGRRTFLKGAGLALTMSGIWQPAHAARYKMRDVIVLLPGIMGSVLQKDGHDVWAVSSGGILGALRTLGRNLDHLRLREDPADREDLGDGVKATRLFPDLHLIPWLWTIDGYSAVARRIEDEFEVTREKNFFEFAYDWRRDNRVAARKLRQESRKWLNAWRTESGATDAKLILVGHSMGGLVARYFIECLDGWRDTRVLFTFGTPFQGSVKALDYIANGFRKPFGGALGPDLTALVRSFTSVHQLLPTYPCVDAGNGLVKVTETTVPELVQERAERALEFHAEIADAVTRNLKDASYAEHRYLLRPVVGTHQPTYQIAALEGGRIAPKEKHPDHDLDGDGTVPRTSATPLDLKHARVETFVANAHGSLQNADAALVQLVGLLSGMVLGARAVEPRVSLRLDDAYLVGEPIHLRGRCTDQTATLTAIVTDARTRQAVARRPLRISDDGTFGEEIAPLAEGTYRARVEGAYLVADDFSRSIDPVSYPFLVAPG